RAEANWRMGFRRKSLKWVVQYLQLLSTLQLDYLSPTVDHSLMHILKILAYFGRYDIVGRLLNSLKHMKIYCYWRYLFQYYEGAVNDAAAVRDDSTTCEEQIGHSQQQ